MNKSILNHDKLFEFINQKLTPNVKNKKERGEVFTPIELVKEMLDKLPKEVWANPDLKWLDPAVGIGNFAIIAYLNLMDGLKEWQPNEEKRRKHILENMLYMVEINNNNIIILNELLCGNKYKLNIFEGSFVDGKEYEQVYKPTIKFDIIMGNPPYNKGGVGRGGGVFWKKFVEESLKMLNKDGYLCYIHPLGWRKPIGKRASAGDLWEHFRKNGYIKYLHISDEKIPYFPKVDYYIYHNSKKIQKTLIYNKFKNNKTEDKYEINHLGFIPNLINTTSSSILNKIFAKNEDNKFNIIYNQSFKPNKNDLDNVGIPHSFYYNLDTHGYIKVARTMTTIPEYYDKPKIIMTYNGGKKPANLYAKFYNNTMGTTNNTMYQLCSQQEGNIFEAFLNSKLINFVLNITQYSQPPNYKNEFKILNLIKKPDGLPNNPTDQDIYNYYGITKEEQEFINKVDYYIYHKTEDKYEINHLGFIPNLINTTSSSILNKIMIDKGDKFNIIRNMSFSPSKENKSSFGIDILVSPKIDGDYHMIKSNIKKYPDFWNDNKVILTHKSGSSLTHSKLYAKYYNTLIGIGDNLMYQIIENDKQGKMLEKYFNSKLITFLIKITQYTDGQFAANEFKILNMISKPYDLKQNPTDQDIYNYYGITKEEQELIEE